MLRQAGIGGEAKGGVPVPAKFHADENHRPSNAVLRQNICMAQLQGKTAIITGAGGGFGEGIARLFAAEGARVALADINPAAVNAVATSIGPAALPVQCDVSDGAQIRALVDATVRAFGAPDIVVNNAGITHKNGPMTGVDEAMFDRLFAVNVKAIYHMTLATVPLMRANGGGSVINIGSTAGMRPRPGLVWYSATKGAVNTLSKAMAIELAPAKIRVNAICPVMGETGLLTSFMGVDDTPENRARFLATIPLGRFSQPRDIANAALFLASAAGEFITGTEFMVDGGRTI
jgi:3-oxoacyl-[acyl-carrier protein] reductase